MKNPLKNTEPKKGYSMRYSGSTWAGQNPVKKEVNTINKIFKLAENKSKSGGFENWTFIERVGKGRWRFNGNYKRYSSVFWIDIHSPKVAMMIKKKLKQKKKYF
ncbi:hypothetical protein LCGC14_1509810 [marine sediment metagenome]|uniref:Uncharacterized protein n=1 Tax=marine sediment metagenome TaxID=412755 RepID=A0A0F9J1R7_9ZZZZ